MAGIIIIITRTGSVSWKNTNKLRSGVTELTRYAIALAKFLFGRNITRVQHVYRILVLLLSYVPLFTFESSMSELGFFGC